MKKSRSFLLIFFIIAFVSAIAVRYIQFVSEIIDFNTGFFIHNAGALKYLHYIVLGFAFVGFIVLAFIEKKRKTTFFRKRLGHLEEGDVCICSVMFLLAGFAVIFTAYRTGFSSLDAMGIITLITGALAYCLAGGILLICKRTFPSVGIMLLMLSGFYIMRMISFFLSNHVIINMSEYLVRLILAVLLALFYLSAGRMFLRAENKTTRLKACVFGYSAAVLAVSEITAKMLFWFGAPSVTRENLSRSESMFIIPDMLAAAEAIALVTLLICLTRRKREASSLK